MKQMELTIKVLSNGPVDPGVFTKAIIETGSATDATVVNYRVLPTKKPAKVGAGQTS